MKKLITMMSSNGFFHFFLFLNVCFVHVYAMEQLAKEVKKIIFYYADFPSKQSLALTCKSFVDIANEFIKEECPFNDFVDKLYMVPIESRIFRSLYENCQDEHKISFINHIKFKSTYFFHRDLQGFDKSEYDSLIVDVFSEHPKNNVKGYQLCGEFVKKNNKKRIKYYNDYCTAMFCMMLLKCEDDKTHQFINVEQRKKIYSCMPYIKQGMDDMKDFKKEKEYLQKKYKIEDVISKVLESEKVSILVWLLEYIRQLKPHEESIKQICDIFKNAKSNESRKLLAKSSQLNGLKCLLDEAVKNKDCAMVKFYLEIMLDQGNDFIGIEIKNFFEFNLDDMLPDLVEAGFRLSSDDICDLTADQIKKYVELYCETYGKNVWTLFKYSHLLLHRAVELADLQLVDYLLSVGLLDLPDSCLVSAIEKAAQQNDIMIVNRLLQKSRYSGEFLSLICFRYYIAMTEKKCNRNNLNIIDKHYVEFSSAVNDIETKGMLRKLLEYGANIFVINNCELAFKLFDDDDAIIKYISSRDDITLQQLEDILRTAVKQSKGKIVCYLFDNEKIALSNINEVKLLDVDDDNMKGTLQQYEKKYQKQQARLQKIINARDIIIKNTMADGAPCNQFDENTNNVSAFSTDESEIRTSIIFLAKKLKNNPKDNWLQARIKEIYTVWLDNIYTRCSDDERVMSALKALSQINPHLKQLTNEEQRARAELNALINGQDFDINKCGTYLTQINQIYYRNGTDKILKEKALLSLALQIKRCINEDEFKGFSWNNENEIVYHGTTKQRDLLFTGEEQIIFFDIFKQFDQIKGEKLDSLFEKYQLIKKNYNENKSFIGFGSVVKNVFASLFNALSSFLCFFNPLRFVW